MVYKSRTREPFGPSREGTHEEGKYRICPAQPHGRGDAHCRRREAGLSAARAVASGRSMPYDDSPDTKR